VSRIDFVTTNFGFGPVAKLVAVARALRRACPTVPLRLLASGHALAFGTMSEVFDECLEVDLDSAPERAVGATDGAAAIVDSLNFDVIPHLTGVGQRLFVVDSLAWLWPRLPGGVQEVAAYAVQGYLLDSRPKRAEELPSNSLRLRPLLDPEIERLAGSRDRDLALVSLGGCCNPFVPPGDLLSYAMETVRSALAVLRPRFRRIAIYTNGQLAASIRKEVGDEEVTVRQSSHRGFLQSLARCGLLLTTPGITATLECIALGTPLKFLPPNNYSQYRILEIYHRRGVLSADVRFSALSCGVEVQADAAEEEAVRRIGEALAAIRPGELVGELTARLEESLAGAWTAELDRLRLEAYATGNGSLDLAEHVAVACGIAAPGGAGGAAAAEPARAWRGQGEGESRRALPSTVESEVKRLVSEVAGVEASSLRGGTRLVEDLGVDSMALLELVGKLEGAFGLVFESGEVDVTDFETVGAIVAAISRKSVDAAAV
jgi:acyl carrier protein